MPVDRNIKGFKSSDFITQLKAAGGPALSSRFRVDILPPREVTRIVNFDINKKNQADRFRDAIERHEGDGLPQNHISLMAKEVALPTIQLETTEKNYGYGNNYKFPTQYSFDEIQFTFITTHGYVDGVGLPERRFFDGWINMVVDTKTGRFNYRDNYVRDIDIYHLDPIHRADYHAKLVNAYPISFPEQNLGSEGNDVIEIQIQFACEYALTNNDIK